MTLRHLAVRYAFITCCTALPLATPAAHAQNSSAAVTAPTRITISAEATEEAAPDYAELRVGVITQALRAQEALARNATRAEQVRKALAASGISARDMQTSQIMVQPQYRYSDNQPPAITGYQATMQLRVISRDLKQSGPLLDLLVAQGANQIDGPVFGISKLEAIRDKARLAAFAQAQERLALYAKAAGLRVKRLTDISESAPDIISPQPMMRLASVDMRAASSQIVPGQLSVRATVTLQAELE